MSNFCTCLLADMMKKFIRKLPFIWRIREADSVLKSINRLPQSGETSVEQIQSFSRNCSIRVASRFSALPLFILFRELLPN